MFKFDVLKYSQFLMVCIGIYPYDWEKSANQFCKSFKPYYISISLVLAIVSSVVFIIQNVSNFQSILIAIMTIVASTQSLGAYINTGLKMNGVQELHLTLQQIVDDGKFIQCFFVVVFI